MRPLALAAALMATALTAAIAPAQAEEIPGSQFSSGYWTGAGHTDDQGAFSYCAVSVAYINGEVLWLGLYNNDTLAVLLSHPNVRFRPGDTFDSWLMLETGLPSHGMSEAWDEAYAGMTLEGIDASIDFLTQGVWLRLLGIGIDEGYDVTGIADALGLARNCQGKLSGKNPFGSTPAKTPPLPEALPEALPEPLPEVPAPAEVAVEAPAGTPAKTPPMPRVPDLKPKTGGGLGTRPAGALGTPAPKPAP